MTQSIRSQNERGRFAIAILVKNDVGTERFLSKIMGLASKSQLDLRASHLQSTFDCSRRRLGHAL